MRSNLYISHYSEMYGANRSLLAILRSRKYNGASDVVVVPQYGAFTDTLQHLEITFEVSDVPLCSHVPSNRKFGVLKFARFCLNKLTKYKNWVNLKLVSRRLAPLVQNLALVHTNSSLTELGAAIAKRAAVPHVWHIREFGDLDYYLHYDWSIGRRRKLFAKAAKCIFVGAQLREYYNCESEGNSVVLYNGVISLAEANSLEWQMERENLKLLVIGYLSETKGQHIAVEALSIIRETIPYAELHIVGDGCATYKERLERSAEELGVEEAVIFHGKVSDVATHYLASKYTLMCSENEAMGRVTPEAMLHGSVVIGFDNAGTSELIEHRKTGMLYNGGPCELAAAVVEVERESSDYSLIKVNAREHAIKQFVEEIYCEKVEEVYREVLAGYEK